MKKIIYKTINWYATHFRFPAKGFSILFHCCKLFGINQWQFLKKLPSGIILNLNLNDHIQKQLFWQGAYEFEEMNLLLHLLNKGDNFLDIGANIGYFSLHAAQVVGTAGMVWSFEPATVIFKQLERHIEMNKFSNIKAIQRGASSQNINSLLYLSSAENYGSTGLQPGDEFSGKTEHVSLVKMDDFVLEYNIRNIGAIKIDVEGHEKQVLQGILLTLEQQHPIILIEVIASQLLLHNNTVEDIYQLLYSLGYKGFYINANKKLAPVPHRTFEGYGIFFLQERHRSKMPVN
ncbi:MAG: FkbM family methyltransferase [Panacibacter sp.]